MSNDRPRSANEVIIAPNEALFLQDGTKGSITVRTGPTVVTTQAQDRPVRWDAVQGRFIECALVEAVMRHVVVPQGHYAVLNNPARSGKHPTPQSNLPAEELRTGEKVMIPGPCEFALWPGQSAQVIAGHQLRSNQYLIVRIYDEKAARENWSKGVMKRTVAAVGEDGAQLDTGIPKDLSVGRLLAILGTEVSYYIPPTGVEVLPENGQYVREALTLENLQYCILVGEDGTKRYEQGPQVVFPKPTERFIQDSDGKRIFRALELGGPLQGIYIKVIADYEEDGVQYKRGDELFLTGADCPIYVPRPEHSIVRYDGQDKSFATVIPAGDGRYVLNRIEGTIKTITGGEEGTMYLPDPRREVFVRRALTPRECELMYPGNGEVAEFNNNLRNLARSSPTTRGAVVTDGQASRSKAIGGIARLAAVEASFAAEVSSVNQHAAPLQGDEFSRASTYSQPRTIQLENRFNGVPVLNVWPGYAIQIVDASGNRRVEVGPCRVLLEYDETLAALELSTGKPKNTDRTIRTGYLLVTGNKVSDIITGETADRIPVQIRVAYRVNFEGEDRDRWFSVANYVKLLTDHGRSRLRAALRQVSVGEFHERAEQIIRDCILGKPAEGKGRTGLSFDENGMRVYDVEVLETTITDAPTLQLLNAARLGAVRNTIHLEEQQRTLDHTNKLEEINRAKAQAQLETALQFQQIEMAKLAAQQEVDQLKAQALLEKLQADLERQKATIEVEELRFQADMTRREVQAKVDQATRIADAELRLAELKAEADAHVAKMNAMKDGLGEALAALGSQETLIKVAEAFSIQNFMGEGGAVDAIEKTFGNLPMARLLIDALQKVKLVTKE